VTNGEVLSGNIVCKNFIVPAGVTATIASAVYVQATGNVTISGTLDGDGLGVQGAASFGWGIAAGEILYVGPGFGFGGGSTSVGGSAYTSVISLAGSGGSGAFVQNPSAGTVGFNSGQGGASGSSFLVKCQGTVTIAATGVVNLNGSNGAILNRTQPTVFISGPGGGSGGVMVVEAQGNVTNSGTISANGGAGDFSHNGGSGGGGGGGGIVILQSNFGTSTTGTVTVAGGAGGLGTGTGVAGGGGGGCGGAGGSCPYLAVNGSPGSTGTISTFGSPL
jgi:hypothetical protein